MSFGSRGRVLDLRPVFAMQIPVVPLYPEMRNVFRVGTRTDRMDLIDIEPDDHGVLGICSRESVCLLLSCQILCPNRYPMFGIFGLLFARWDELSLVDKLAVL